MGLKRYCHRWNLYVHRNYHLYLIKVKMKLKKRLTLLAIALVFLVLLMTVAVVDLPPNDEAAMSSLEEQFWRDLNQEYAAKNKNRSLSELVMANKPLFLERRATYMNVTHDTRELIHPKYKETIYSLDRPNHNSSRQRIIDWLLKQYNVDWDAPLNDSPWKIAAGWVNEQQITPDYAPELGAILHQMSTRKITVADVGKGGTQLKLQLTLEGSQKVVFKPMWYSRDYILTGTPYAGKDRHNGEVATFHLNRILGFDRSPLVVGRRLNLETEIIPVATAELLKTFYMKDKDVCFYGKCMYCKGESTGVCGKGVMMEGILGLWLPPQFPLGKRIRHPWGRTYKNNKKAVWETKPQVYCDYVQKMDVYTKHHPRLLMDIIDASISDYIVGDADRHHMELFKGVNKSILVMLDNGKSFGNPTWDVRSILAPLEQCCMLRASTWERLLMLRHGILSAILKTILGNDPISPVLDSSYYVAITRRLTHIVDAVETCLETHSSSSVLIRDKYS